MATVVREVPVSVPARLRRAVQPLPVHCLVALAGTCALGVWLTARSLRWPFYQDALVMHYIAARILDGAVPYRDILDMNLPGTYLIHALGLRLFGPGDAGGRAFDLAVLAGTCAGLAAALRTYGRWASAFGAAGVWVYHLGLGSVNAGQRDFVMCLPLAWMTAGALSHQRTGRLPSLTAAGLFLGVAASVKPSAILLVPVLATLAWHRRPDARGRVLAALALGLGLSTAGIAAWLVSRGGLVPFFRTIWSLAGLYGSLAREPFALLIKGHRYARNFTPWAALGLVSLWRTGRLDARGGLLVAGTAFGFVHYVLQGKAWEYQLYPAAVFAIALGAAGLGAALSRRRVVLTTALVVAFSLAIVALAFRAPRADPSGREATIMARPHAVAQILSPLITPGATVQILDPGTDAGIATLYVLGLHQPTPVLYDWALFEHPEDPWVQALRVTFIEALRANPPVSILFFERSWPRAVGYDRLREYPELEVFLGTRYRVAVEGPGLRVYTLRNVVLPVRAAGIPP